MSSAHRLSKLLETQNESHMSLPSQKLAGIAPQDSNHGLQPASRHESQTIIISSKETSKTPGRGCGRRSSSRIRQSSMQSKSGLEHRHDKRYKTLVSVDILHQDQVAAPGVLYNISNSGMFIICNKIADISRVVDIRLPVTNGDNLKIMIPGFVVHRNSYGFGLMFRELDTTTRNIVVKLTARQS